MTSGSTSALSNRWLQAILALIVMMMISPYEYTFTLFEAPIAKVHHWPLPTVALTFTIYIVVASLFMIPSGFWSDRWQPRWFTTAAGAVTGLGWILSAQASSPAALYLAYGLGSLGPGYIYCNSVNNALKWFPEANRRGLAVGLIDMGFGMGSAIFIPILSGIIKQHGYPAAFTDMGIAMVVVIVLVAQFLRYPEPGWLPAGYNPEAEAARARRRARGTANAVRDFKPAETLATWQFWVAWVALTLITSSGLMITAHMVEMAKTNILVAGSLVGVTAATLSRIPNGVMRWVAGGISDYIGRELSMFISFVVCGLALITMAHVHNGTLFIVLALVAMGTWGPLFSLFPALVGDYWGRKYSGVNYGMVYTGKGAGGIFAGFVAAALYTSTHSWATDFHLAGLFAIVSGLMAMFVLRRPAASTAVSATATEAQHSS